MILKHRGWYWGWQGLLKPQGLSPTTHYLQQATPTTTVHTYKSFRGAILSQTTTIILFQSFLQIPFSISIQDTRKSVLSGVSYHVHVCGQGALGFLVNKCIAFIFPLSFDPVCALFLIKSLRKKQTNHLEKGSVI